MISRFPLAIAALLTFGMSCGLAGAAHYPRGEDSRGLWQINATAKNTQPHSGAKISPWTTTHGVSVRTPVRPTIMLRPSIRLR